MASSLRSVLVPICIFSILLLSHSVKCDIDEEDSLLRSLNSYRASLNLTALVKNKKAECLADEVAEQLQNQPCTSSAGANALPGTKPQFPSYPALLSKCRLNVSNTRDGAVLPACVPNLESSLVVSNFTRSRYSNYLSDTKFTGVGIGHEDNWIVVVLTTSTPEGSYVPAQSAPDTGNAIATASDDDDDVDDLDHDRVAIHDDRKDRDDHDDIHDDRKDHDNHDDLLADRKDHDDIHDDRKDRDDHDDIHDDRKDRDDRPDHDDEEDVLLQGINALRATSNVTALTKTRPADCFADEFADRFQDQLCSNTTGSIAAPATVANISSYPDLLFKCGLNVSGGFVLPSCAPGSSPSVVLSSLKSSKYAASLTDPGFTGVGVGSEDDWLVVVLTSNTPAGPAGTANPNTPNASNTPNPFNKANAVDGVNGISKASFVPKISYVCHFLLWLAASVFLL